MFISGVSRQKKFLVYSFSLVYSFTIVIYIYMCVYVFTNLSFIIYSGNISDSVWFLNVKPFEHYHCNVVAYLLQYHTKHMQKILKWIFQSLKLKHKLLNHDIYPVYNL
ncbi:hypothetical protein EDEG_03486 [Edhazardia aedis USNM 41457]|uniref:Uncharacterized protein n=1 Tax=Edhazardia aedis (strain USNM 41457) TaxID=1003232 RepID=J9DL37_EDHAE|nr:hypothetical protein EDEG_03486 [Edhazardia aedis USNM 41457]|eukprot:EJW02062.1 hypothetical protein EDEG_03486 [Edhazardia aedis USNM 41457]